MASSKPIFKMLYLTFDSNFGKQQLLVMENVVFYNENTFKTIFMVDVEVQSVNGKYDLYKVLELHETFPLTDD